MVTKRPRLRPTTERGYDAAHRKLRARWDVDVQAGIVDCAHCGERIQPGTPWDLGHHDDDRTQYTGPEHRSCNREHKARRAAERNARTAIADPEPLEW